MNIGKTQQLIISALDRMFDEACEEGSSYEDHFQGYTGIHFDKTNGQLRLDGPDGMADLFTITVDPGTKAHPKPIPEGKRPFPCPNCKSKSMSTVDDVLAFRAVHRFTTKTADGNIIGTLITDPDDDYSDGENTRLCCNKCGASFAIPANVDIDWED